METYQEFKDTTKMAFFCLFVCFVLFALETSHLPDHPLSVSLSLSPMKLWLYLSCTVFIESHNAEIMLMLKTFNLFILCNIHPELFFYKSRFWRGQTST